MTALIPTPRAAYAARKLAFPASLLWLLAGGILGTTLGFALGIFIYPFWFLREVAMEEVANRERATAVASGTFVHVTPSDPIHWGRGRVTILSDPATGERIAHLERDFEVGPGPRFHVYLAGHPDVRSASDFRSSGTVDLGRLRAFRGSQIYPIPPEVDLSRYASVVIWCKEFSVLITSASLRNAAAETPRHDG